MSDGIGTMYPKVEWLAVVGDADTWRSLGLTVTDDGVIPLVGASIRLVTASDHPGEGGIVRWALSGASEMDGLLGPLAACEYYRVDQQSGIALGGAVLDAVLSSRGAGAETREMSGALYGTGAQLGFGLPFSRSQELEADRIGMIFM